MATRKSYLRKGEREMAKDLEENTKEKEERVAFFYSEG